MPPKEKLNKKAIKKNADNAIDEATFGLKNKSKSKKVQQFINRVEKSVKNNTGLTDAIKQKQALKEAKIAKQLQEEELRALLNEGISNQFGKNKKESAFIATKLGISTANEQVIKLLEEFSDDSDDSDDEYKKKRNKQETYILDDEPISVEVFREKTIEDIIEEQRAKLAIEGKKGTPVTEESFAKWRAEKLKKKQEEAETRVKVEQAKKKGGKGLSVLSGKELFNYNASLFIDDDAALDANEENALTEETRKIEAQQEVQQQEEAKKAQEEQERLQELQRLELEELERKYQEKRKRASVKDRITFQLGNIVINEVVFIEEEIEDLEPFPELVEGEEMINDQKHSMNGVDVDMDDNDDQGEGESFEINMNEDEEEDEDDEDMDEEEEEEEEEDEDESQ